MTLAERLLASRVPRPTDGALLDAVLLCRECGLPARRLFTNDDGPFAADNDQWYECAAGHPTKKAGH